MADVTPPQAGTRITYSDLVVIAELRGDYPTVDFFGDVNIAELTAGDNDPMYLTIPIGKADVVSGNGNYYSADFLAELERQVRGKRPTGEMGHEPDAGDEAKAKAENPMSFPAEAIFWVGARRIGELLWGKGYLPAGAARDRIRRYKAANKTIGTSIMATSARVWNAARNALEPVLETFDLHRIDIGPVEKLGIRDLALVPILTREMLAAQEAATVQEETMTEKTRAEVLQELRGKVPAPRRNWQPIISHEQAELSALRELLDVDDRADLLVEVGKLREQIAAQAQAAVRARIVEMATPDPKRKPEEDRSVKVESVRDLVIEMVNARNPQTIQEAETAYGQVVEMQSVKDTLAAAVQGTMGPRQRTPIAAQSGSDKGGGFFTYPAEESA